MPDGHRRIARFREEPRTDLPLAVRVLRFLEPLQQRLAAGVARTDPGAAVRTVRWEQRETRGVRLSTEGGEAWRGAVVDVYASGGGPPEAGLTAAFVPRRLHLPVGLFHLGYAQTGEASQEDAFSGLVALTSSCDAVEGPWRTLCDAHPDVADYAGFSHAFRQRVGAGCGLAFDALRGHPEAAFLFLRQCGRAILPTYLDAIGRAQVAGPETAAEAREARQRLAAWAGGRGGPRWLQDGAQAPPAGEELTALLGGA